MFLTFGEITAVSFLKSHIENPEIHQIRKQAAQNHRTRCGRVGRARSVAGDAPAPRSELSLVNLVDSRIARINSY